MYKKRETPSDFCLLETDPQSRLTQFERLTLIGGTELERAVSWLARQFATIRPQEGFDRLDLEAMKQAAAYYSGKWSAKPETFFVQPLQAPRVLEKPVHGLRDGKVIDVSFRSAYKFQHPSFQSEGLKADPSNIVHARVWRHDSHSRGCLVAIHGWTMGDQRINSLTFLPGLFYDLGLDVVLFELPHHGRRRNQESGRDQAEFLFPSSDLALTNESVAQTISDLRELRLYLEGTGARKVGCIGMSLGGYISTVWASLDPLEFCIPIVPMVSMHELYWEVLTKSPSFGDLSERGLTADIFKEAFRIHSPLFLEPRIRRERALIIAGIGDHVVPARQPRLLWEHWGRPQMFRLSGGHTTHFNRSRALLEIVDFLGSLEFADQLVLKELLTA